MTTVAIKKGGGGHKLDKKKAQLEIAKSFGCENSADILSLSEVPKGAKVKTVDRRPWAMSFKDVKSEKTCFASEILGPFFDPHI